MDNKENNIIKRGPSQKDKLLEEKKALEKEIRELSGVSKAQIGYKEAHIKLIDKMLAQIDQSNGKDNNKEMAQQEYLRYAMMQKKGMAA